MCFGKPIFLSDKTSLPEIGGDVANYWAYLEPEYMKEVVLNGLSDFEKDKANSIQKLTERALSFD